MLSNWIHCIPSVTWQYTHERCAWGFSVQLHSDNHFYVVTPTPIRPARPVPHLSWRSSRIVISVGQQAGSFSVMRHGLNGCAGSVGVESLSAHTLILNKFPE